MKTPRGNVRKLILALGDIQDLVGEAQGVASNDRDVSRMDHLMPLLHRAFEICVEARSVYPPIERHLIPTSADRADWQCKKCYALNGAGDKTCCDCNSPRR